MNKNEGENEFFFLDYVALARLLVRRDNRCQPLITNKELWHRRRNGNDNARNGEFDWSSVKK